MNQNSLESGIEGKNDENYSSETKGRAPDARPDQNDYDYNSKLIVYAAVYGLSDVTNAVRKIIDNKTQSLSIPAVNQIFGDSWVNVKKTLIVVWGFGTEGSSIQVSIVTEGSTLNIDESKFASKFVPTNYYGKINVLGAVYGLQDHSHSVQQMVQNHNVTVNATNETFGDSWQGVPKSFVIVYRMGAANPHNILDNIYIKIVREGQQSTI